MICNDGDEFWLPEKGSLKDYLIKPGSVVKCPRQDMLLDEEQVNSGSKYYQSRYTTQHPIDFSNDPTEYEKGLSLIIHRVMPKIIVNPHGLVRMRSGNHSARHVARRFSQRTEPGIQIYHYPFRSFEQFEKRIRGREILFNSPGARVPRGKKWVHWVKLLQEGRLDEEFRNYVLPNEDIDVLLKYGVLRKDEFGRERIGRALASGQPR